MEMMEIAEQENQREGAQQKAVIEATAAMQFALGAQELTPQQEQFRAAFAKVRAAPYGSRKGFGFSIPTEGRQPNNK